MGCVYFSIDIFPYYSTFIFMVGVSVYFLHFYNQYSSFVSLFLLCLSLFIHKSTKSVRRHSTETMLRCANYSFLSSFASTSNSSIICSLISSLNSSYMLRSEELRVVIV